MKQLLCLSLFFTSMVSYGQEKDSASWVAIYSAISSVMNNHYTHGADPADHWAPTKEQWLQYLPNATMQGDTLYSKPYKNRIPVMVLCKDGSLIYYSYFKKGFRSTNMAKN